MDTNSSLRNGAPETPYHYRTHRAPELRQRNRRVGVIVGLVALALIIFTIIYVAFFGGANIDPIPPLHSSLHGLHSVGNIV